MEEMRKNKGMVATLVLATAFVVGMATGVLADIGTDLELVPFPEGANLESELLSLMAVDFAVCFAADKAIERLSRG